MALIHATYVHYYAIIPVQLGRGDKLQNQSFYFPPPLDCVLGLFYVMDVKNKKKYQVTATPPRTGGLKLVGLRNPIGTYCKGKK